MKSKYTLTLIAKSFKGCLIKNGNRVLGEKIYDQVLLYLRHRISALNPNLVLYKVLNLIRPSVDIWTKKRGGSSYKLAFLITEERSFKIAIHWLIKEAKLRKERTIVDRLGCEIIETLKGRSLVNVKKRDDIHKTALANRAFLKFK